MMLSQKRVSMIMPCFNSAPYLDHMLESIYMQKYDNIELIVAYDDSQDGTLTILDNWKKKFDNRGYRYLIVRNPSRAGIVNGINAAMPFFTGEYITFPDSDDYMFPEFVSTMVEALESNPEYNWARCDNLKVIGKDLSFDEKNVVDFELETEYNQEYDLALDKRYNHLGGVMNLLLYTIPRAPWRMLCRSEFLLRVIPDKKFFPHPSSHELPIALPLAAAEDFLHVPKPLYKYTIHQDGYYNSRTKNLHQMIPYLDSMEQLAVGCIRQLPVDEDKKQQYLLANSLYYTATKAYYAMIHNAVFLAQIYADWLEGYMREFTGDNNMPEKFPAILYWKYYFRMAPKIALGIKLDREREIFDPDIWNLITNAESVILYGAGHSCGQILPIMNDLGLTIMEIWDMNAEAIGEKYGYQIKSPRSDMMKNIVIINTILNKKTARQVNDKLKKLGYFNLIETSELDQGFRFAMLDKYFPHLV